MEQVSKKYEEKKWEQCTKCKAWMWDVFMYKHEGKLICAQCGYKIEKENSK